MMSDSRVRSFSICIEVGYGIDDSSFESIYRVMGGSRNRECILTIPFFKVSITSIYLLTSP